MMRRVVASSLRFRGLLVAVAAGVMVLGVTQLPQASVDTLPEFQRPTVEVQTEALGLSAEEVEQFVTVPLEQDLLNGVAFLEEIESTSLPGLSSVVLTFEPGTDLLDARQVVAERLAQAVGAAGLPEVSKPPQMLQPLSSTSRAAMVRLTPHELSPIEVSVLARWVIVPRLLGVQGVANVAIWGFRDRQLQVLVEPERLRDVGVTLNQIVRTAGNALEVSPLSFLEASSPGTGGWIDTVNQRLHIFHEQAITTPQELARVPLEGEDGSAVLVNGRAVTLGHVAEVVEGHQPLIGDALCQDGQCLLLVIEKFPAANTPQVTRGVEQALEAMRPGLPGMAIDAAMYRPAEYIESSFANLGWSLGVGGALLVLVLALLLFQWRTTLIAAVSVALALTTAGLVLVLLGETVNTMVVAGLAAGLGVIVYDAVLDVQNVVGRVRRRHHRNGGGVPIWRTITEATLEMRRAGLYAGLVVVAGAAPVFFLEREAAAFLPPIALSFLLAIGVSMVVALTVTPALGMLLLARPFERRESPAVAWTKHAYDGVARRVVRGPAPAVVALGVAVAVGLVALPFVGPSMRPALRERDVLVQLQAAPGTSLPRMDEIVAGQVQALAAIPGVREVGAHVGRAVTSDQVVNVNSGEVWLNIEPSADYDATLRGIEATVARRPEVAAEVTTYSAKRVSEILGGADEDVVVRIYGENPEVLRDLADQVAGVLSGIEGIGRPRIAQQLQEPVIEVEVDIDRAQRFGVKPGDARRAAAILLNGITVGNLFEEQKVFDVVVWGAPGIRAAEADVRNLLIDRPGGGHVRLGEVAEVRTVPNPTVIRHESVATFVDVAASVQGRGLGDVAGDVETAIGAMTFPLEYHAELLGAAAAGSGASRTVVVAITAAIAVFLLFQAAFTSWRLAALASFTLPVALAGSVVAIWITGGVVSLGSVAGLLVVLGIGARGTLVLIRRYQELERHEGDPFGAELVVRGTRERLGPLATAAMGTAVLLAPFAFGSGAGFELVRPLAVAVLGGLVGSLVLHAVIVPALYLRFGYIAEPDTTSDDLYAGMPEVEAAPRG